jgi:hypothetical protein
MWQYPATVTLQLRAVAETGDRPRTVHLPLSFRSTIQSERENMITRKMKAMAETHCILGWRSSMILSEAFLLIIYKN